MTDDNNNNNNNNNDEMITPTTSVTTSAEEYKELGNKAFGEKQYQQAIQYYTEAIKRDPTNHVYFSNRSASYGGMGGTNSSNNNWKLAAVDAKECIRLDPTFIKGYYRLANAQIELKEYDHAIATIRQGLTIDPNNVQLTKQMRIVQQQKKVIAAKMTQQQQQQQPMISLPPSTAGTQQHQFDTATAKELQELQILYTNSTRELNTVQINLGKTQREHKLTELTKSEISKDSEDGTESSSNNNKNNKYYRSIGKMFVLQNSRNDVIEHLNNRLMSYEKEELDMTQKIQYIQRQIQSHKNNMEELLSSATTTTAK